MRHSINTNYTPEEREDVKEWVKDIDSCIDEIVEGYKVEGESVLIRDIVNDIADDHGVDRDKLRSFLQANNSKYFVGVPKYAVVLGKLMEWTLFYYYRNKGLKKLRRNKTLKYEVMN